jgi:tape measure domain-containing protein
MPTLADLFVRIRGNQREVRGDVETLRGDLQQVGRMRVAPKIQVPQQALNDLKGFESRLAALGRTRTKLAVDTVAAKSDVTTLTNQLQRLQRQRHDVPVGLQGKVDEQIRQVERELEVATRRHHTIPLKVERIDTSMATIRGELDRLRKTVQIPAEVVDPHIGSQVAKIRQQATSSLEAAGTEGGHRFSGAFTRFGPAAVGTAIGGLATGGVLALGAIGVAAGKMGLDVASGNEQARISFTTMLGSAQKADVFLRQLQQFAAQTPFEFPELQTAASSLISAGINASKVIPIMRTLGDVTSGMGTGSEGVRRATVALQQMNAAGRITGEDLNQLRDAGIPVYDLLAKATGKSKAEVVALAQAGKLGHKELGQMMAALESGAGLERFSGLMDKQSHSLAGMASTLKDTFGQGLANALTPIFPLIKTGMEGISSAAASTFGWLGKHQGDISRIFSVAGEVLQSFGRIVSGTFSAFAGSVSHGHDAFKSFADFIGTHQADITQAIVTGGKAALELGKGLATGASVGLRAFAVLSDYIGTIVNAVIQRFGQITHSAAIAFGWIPGIGDKLKIADAQFAVFGEAAKAASHKTGDAARTAADAIDRHVVPAINAAQGSLDKLGKTEIAKAQLRDTARRAALAIDAVGTSTTGAQIKLKSFNDVSRLGATEQVALKGRLNDAKTALRKQIDAMTAAHAGQGQLTTAWKIGRDRLYAEFLQMHLSKAEAKKLANQYAGIPPKVKTNVSAPGMTGTRRDVRDLDNRINGLNSKHVDIRFTSNLGKFVVTQSPSGRTVRVKDPGLAAGGILPGYTPGRDVHKFFSATAGELDLSGGEGILRPELTAAIGPTRFNAANREARAGRVRQGLQYLGGYADGGTVNRSLTVTTHRVPASASRYVDSVDHAAGAFARIAGTLVARTFAAQLRDAMAATGVGSSRKMTWKGGTFTERFVNTLKAAEMRARAGFSIFQGGFRPATSYSGTSHRGDAVDLAPITAAVVRALRLSGVAAWRRGPKQGYTPHIHGVPLPGFGFAAGSGIWQAQNYLAGGDGLGGRDYEARVPRPTAVSGGASVSGGVKSMAQQLLRLHGWEAQFPSLNYIINHESGWNVRARNPSSGAYGLGQALPASKMRPFGADYLTSANTQLRWLMSYIGSRYGNPNNAAAFWRAHHWYRPGGIVPLADGAVVRGGRGGVLATIGEGKRDELVTPLPRGWQQARPATDPALTRLAAALEAGRTGPAFHFTTYNPISEPESVTTNKALQRIAALGLV